MLFVDTCPTRLGIAAPILAVLCALVPAPAWPFHLETHCRAEDRCRTDTQCNDRDPCTQDTCLPPVDGGSEGCCSHDASSPCLDTFLCLDVEAPGPQGPARPRTVHLADSREDTRFEVRELRELCAPADRGDGIHDATAQFARYRIVPESGSTPSRTDGVSLETSLGRVVVDLDGGDRLLVPATADGASPAKAGAGEHFKCYGVTTSGAAAKAPASARLTVASRLTGTATSFVATRPSRLCTATDLDGAGFRNACGALLCFVVERPDHQRRRGTALSLRDRFGRHRVTTVGESEVCLPATVDGRTCAPRGFACETGADCETGHCTDGVCCDTACAAACYACLGSLTGVPHGTCAPIASPGASDTAPTSLCGGSTGCAAATCACDGLGHCTARP